MTPAARRWIASLQERRDACAERLKQPATTDIERARRACDIVWLDSYDLVLMEAAYHLPRIEFEATLPADEPYGSLRDKLVAEEWAQS